MDDKITSTKAVSETMGIIWRERLKELDTPFLESNYYIAELYERSNALLRRLNEQEQIIIRLMGK